MKSKRVLLPFHGDNTRANSLRVSSSPTFALNPQNAFRLTLVFSPTSSVEVGFIGPDSDRITSSHQGGQMLDDIAQRTRDDLQELNEQARKQARFHSWESVILGVIIAFALFKSDPPHWAWIAAIGIYLLWRVLLELISISHKLSIAGILQNQIAERLVKTNQRLDHLPVE